MQEHARKVEVTCKNTTNYLARTVEITCKNTTNYLARTVDVTYKKTTNYNNLAKTVDIIL